MKKIGDTYVLDRDDLIRMNCFVREGVNVTGYCDWYNSISRNEQVTLAFSLYTMSMQTGFHVRFWDQSAANSGVSSEFSAMLKDLTSNSNVGKLRAWLTSASDNDRQAAFLLFVKLFGESEAAVMMLETVDTCNHWWHRNLLDPKVINDLMSNPHWYATSPKDDCK